MVVVIFTVTVMVVVMFTVAIVVVMTVPVVVSLTLGLELLEIVALLVATARHGVLEILGTVWVVDNQRTSQRILS